MRTRPTLDQARAQFVHRFTMEHVPEWARVPAGNHKYYAPQFRTDAEWYANTKFPGEDGITKRSRRYCYTTGQTWPMGKWLDAPFSK